MSALSTRGVILDTHVWVWWVNGSKELSKTATHRINQAMAKKSVYLSAISAWEVALLVRQGRLVLTMDVQDWTARTEVLPFVQIVPVDIPIAVKSVHLPGDFHKDPADRIIVATALRFGLPVVTRDDRIWQYSHVQSVW
ncbi:MAG: type II toxin-antitoxin system VapC family toxin [Candidatus Tectomicrobia bacterium]|nr:type II toxin-antitoxin system VapC family toxin [Candidatus Tectomicrobia bacterium]